jgi:hypothetical protein
LKVGHVGTSSAIPPRPTDGYKERLGEPPPECCSAWSGGSTQKLPVTGENLTTGSLGFSFERGVRVSVIHITAQERTIYKFLPTAISCSFPKQTTCHASGNHELSIQRQIRK